LTVGRHRDAENRSTGTISRAEKYLEGAHPSAPETSHQFQAHFLKSPLGFSAKSHPSANSTAIIGQCQYLVTGIYCGDGSRFLFTFLEERGSKAGSSSRRTCFEPARRFDYHLKTAGSEITLLSEQ